MDPKQLPPRPSLEQYKKLAKELLKACQAGDTDAHARIKEHQPRPRKKSSSTPPEAGYILADAQFAIAREHGFESWPKFARHIESLNRPASPDLLAASEDLKIFAAAQKAVVEGDVAALEQLMRENPEFFRQQLPPPYVPSGPGPSYESDARAIIASEHQFKSWDEFERHREEVNRKGSRIARFEAAVEAVITGDASTLTRLLGEDPDLVRARSDRKHHSTLLHYVGANGVEGFRQKTPKNALQIARILLDAGAEIDAMADMYGGGSMTLGLIATSIHPHLAGVQPELIEFFIARGARIDGNEDEKLGKYTGGSVNSCLANGRLEAAQLLAGRGAKLDLEGAAGIGRLDLVKSFFNPDGSMKPTATPEQLKSGFNWACEYGQTDVVEFLVRQGIIPGEKHRGETGLHWAALGALVELVRLLLQHQFPTDVKDDSFEATPLKWALHGWENKSEETPPDDYYETVALLVSAGSPVEPRFLTWEPVQKDPRMLAALKGGEPA
jgi:hypothetical protein